MLESVSVSGLIESMRYNGGHSTKQSSTVTMAVTHKFATEVATLIEEFQKKGIEPKEGLIRLELIAHYADDSIAPEEQQYEVVDEDEMAEQIVDKLNEDINESVADALEGTDMEADAEEAPSE